MRIALLAVICTLCLATTPASAAESYDNCAGTITSLPAVIDYVAFMKVQETSYLDIRFDLLFSIYVIFAVAAILRYLWLGWHALLGNDPGPPDPTKAGSGV